MEEADALSDRVGIMNRGSFVEAGTPKRLKNSVRGGETLKVDVEPGDRKGGCTGSEVQRRQTGEGRDPI